MHAYGRYDPIVIRMTRVHDRLSQYRFSYTYDLLMQWFIIEILNLNWTHPLMIDHTCDLLNDPRGGYKKKLLYT